jgi:hypothetical protein
MIPSDVDGAAEEGTPFVPARGMHRIAFVPNPAGFRFYHTHVVAGGDLNRIHPLHLHRHSFELTRLGGKATAGVIKDVVMLGGFQELEFDFVADNPARTLLHCHQQLHMDFGFMALFDYV